VNLVFHVEIPFSKTPFTDKNKYKFGEFQYPIKKEQQNWLAEPTII